MDKNKIKKIQHESKCKELKVRLKPMIWAEVTFQFQEGFSSIKSQDCKSYSVSFMLTYRLKYLASFSHPNNSNNCFQNTAEGGFKGHGRLMRRQFLTFLDSPLSFERHMQKKTPKNTRGIQSGKVTLSSLRRQSLNVQSQQRLVQILTKTHFFFLLVAHSHPLTFRK